MTDEDGATSGEILGRKRPGARNSSEPSSIELRSRQRGADDPQAVSFTGVYHQGRWHVTWL